MMAMSPATVTFVAVPKLSIAIYKVIIHPCAVSSKPSMDCNNPSAAIIAPPGTPGAATIAIPSIKIKPAIIPKEIGILDISMIAMAHATIFIVLPERCIVAQSGITNAASSRFTPFLIDCSNVTGIVAAEDCVPNASRKHITEQAERVFLRYEPGNKELYKQQYNGQEEYDHDNFHEHA